MFRFARIVTLACSMIVIMANMGAAQKITQDPNAPGAVKQDDTAASSKVDPRLAQKVTLEARGKSVRAILSDLSKMTGITLYAGYNDADWQVRDRKMNIFAKDATLAHLLSSIARVMNFKWSIRGEPGAYTYRLYMDRRALLDAESKRQREQQMIEQKRTDSRMKMLEGFASIANLSPEEMEMLRNENPFMYIIARSGLASSLSGFFGEVPMSIDALASGQQLTMNAGMLSPRAQQGLVQSLHQLKKLQESFGDKVHPLPDGIASDMSRVTVRLNSHMEMMEGRPEANLLLGLMTIEYYEPESDRTRNEVVPFFDPESKFSKLIGELLLEREETGKSLKDVAKDHELEFMEAYLASVQPYDFGEPVVEHPYDPELLKKIKMEVASRRLDDVQAELARSSGFAVVSDDFGVNFGVFRSLAQDEEVEIREVLDNIAQGFRYNWEKHESIIEFRDRYWFRKRAAQIPEAWIEAWRKALKETKTLDLDALSQIAALTQEQINANLVPDQVISGSGVLGIVMIGRDVLRLYSVLNSGQRTALFSESGLDLRHLSPDQWTLVQKMLSQRNVLYLQNPEAQITLSASREYRSKDQPELVWYTFTATTSDGYEPITWQIVGPYYKEPEEKEEPKEKPGAEGSQEPASPDSSPESQESSG